MKSGLWSFMEKKGVEGERGSVRSDIPSLVVICSPDLFMSVRACSLVFLYVVVRFFWMNSWCVLTSIWYRFPVLSEWT